MKSPDHALQHLVDDLQASGLAEDALGAALAELEHDLPRRVVERLTSPRR